MRMSTPFSSERGAAAAVVVLFLSAALGLAALVVDIGNAWQERRQVITATDAAALAAVQDYVVGDPGCALSAESSVTANNAAATMTSCVHTPPSGGNPGRVTVEAEVDVQFFFAPILGIADKTVASSTTANYDLASTVDGGLRPFGLCDDYLSELSPAMTSGNGQTYRIYYGRTAQVTNCNSGDPISGNWGVLDFDGGSNSQNDIKDWTMDGYDGSVSIGEWIEGTPGSFSNSLSTELDHLINNVDHFTLPIFSDYNDLNGANAEFLIADFAVVKLHGYKTTGSQDGRYIDLEFLDEVVQGTGGGTGAGLGAYVIGICAVDGVDAATACN